MHVFQSLEDGGLQTVRAKDPANREQIALIQAHLKEEADKLQRGDFSDSAKIHAKDSSQRNNDLARSIRQ